MQLRQTPGGTWCGTEKDWKTAMKAEGIDLKTYAGRVFVDVPVDKKGLMEFLTFYGVSCVAPTAPAAPDVPIIVAQAEGAPLPPPAPVVFSSQDVDLDALFQAAPLGQQLTLAGIAVENAFQNQKK